jgi:omega-hydroxy-beta-dihydromenaquinone-9 sulfotransferase
MMPPSLATREEKMSSASPAPPPAHEPEWAPRLWQGADFFAWIKLLARNRFAIHPAYWYIAVIVTVVSVGHTVLRILQNVVWGRTVRRTAIDEPPIFIIGHWRTGTTLLHELLIHDERFGYPNYYQCLAPTDFLLTEGLITKYMKFLMPAHRPMDNMKIGFDRPQEDEFALCLLGAGSPYDTIAFPNRPPQSQEFLELVNLPPRQLRRWRRIFKNYLRTLTCKLKKRLVLKSPPHTARIPVLKQMFPGALFVHIVRDPYVVYPSTVNLWRTLFQTHGMQKPTGAGLEDHVLETYVRMYQRLEEGRTLLDPRQFYELRYEDLIGDPVGEMKKLYAHFGLGGFEAYRPRLETYLASVKGYKTNRYQLTPEERDTVTRRWGATIRQYGYGG